MNISNEEYPLMYAIKIGGGTFIHTLREHEQNVFGKLNLKWLVEVNEKGL